jgi:hypothetical protein
MRSSTKEMRLRGRRGPVPLIHRDIKRFSTVKDVSRSDILSDADWRRGRFAPSDQVATCLLRKGYAAAMPVRREVRVARNRRRLVVAFIAVLLWWVAGLVLG